MQWRQSHFTRKSKTNYFHTDSNTMNRFIQKHEGLFLCQRAAEQSVQWIGGILRDLQAFFWLRVFPALRHFPSPPANH